MKKLVHIFVSFGVLLGGWQLVVSLGNYNAALFPGPVKVAKGIVELIRKGILWEDIKDSLIRFFIGYVTAILCGVVLGLLLGLHRKVWEFINPIVQFLRPISPIAWLPFIVLWFGIGEIPAIVIIFIAGFFPILISTVTAVKGVDPVYIKVSNNFGLSKFEKLFQVIVPSVLPNILTGIHLALGTAWVFLVAGEMVGAQSGLGYLIIDARNNLRMDLLLGAMVTIGAIGILLDFLIGLLEKCVVRTF
ncbi:ABC transporter permease [[Clostridium] polysaccharolyticum]|uniref:NitT/TauT family transport system permease protein n=1 Tax=[Clostridium] polysaccharolyticum TaxID=29364 RepID=A0A1I0AFD3_9FIRM|nr:ABC transporter permease [[Clostridium] polysaccharolyticum]SES92949.1 NitT/TauT family transport system permease protein [[Clostridium] polysaccharolyticum]